MLEENLVIGRGTSVGTGTVITNSVIGKNCCIGQVLIMITAPTYLECVFQFTQSRGHKKIHVLSKLLSLFIPLVISVVSIHLLSHTSERVFFSFHHLFRGRTY